MNTEIEMAYSDKDKLFEEIDHLFRHYDVPSFIHTQTLNLYSELDVKKLIDEMIEKTKYSSSVAFTLVSKDQLKELRDNSSSELFNKWRSIFHKEISIEELDHMFEDDEHKFDDFIIKLSSIAFKESFGIRLDYISQNEICDF